MHASIRSRALTTSALVAAALGLTASQASAATTAQVQNGTLTVTGTIGADDIALRLQLGVPTTLKVDTNGDFIADFSSTAAPSPRSTSWPAAATTRSRTSPRSPRSPP